MLTESPLFARNVGPGKTPLYASTADVFPPPRSTVAGAAVRAKLLYGEAPGGIRSGLRVVVPPPAAVGAPITSGAMVPPMASTPAEANAVRRNVRRLRRLGAAWVDMACSPDVSERTS